jgi:hypothetical protein
MVELKKELLGLDTTNTDLKLEIDQTVTRMDEPYTKENEELLQEWAKKCNEASIKHEKKGYLNKTRYRIWAVPNMVLTVVFSGLSGVFGDEQYMKYISTCGFIASGIITGVSSLYNFGKSQQQHFDFSTRYSEVALEVQAELIKQRHFRTPADVFCVRTLMKYEQLNRNAPAL